MERVSRLSTVVWTRKNLPALRVGEAVPPRTYRPPEIPVWWLGLMVDIGLVVILVVAAVLITVAMVNRRRDDEQYGPDQDG